MDKRIIGILLLLICIGLIGIGQAGKYYTCTEDCPEPQPGYKLIGCTVVVNHIVQDTQGLHVPSGSSNGYVYIQSKTEYDENGNIVHDEILACDYWKEDQPLPPSDEEQFDMNDSGETNVTAGPQFAEELERDMLVDAVKIYNTNTGNLPGFVHSILGNEVMHVYATMPDGGENEYAAITENGQIVEGGNWIDFDQNGQYDVWQDRGIEPTMELYVDETGTIKYEGLTFGTMVKELFVDIGMQIYGIFA